MKLPHLRHISQWKQGISLALALAAYILVLWLTGNSSVCVVKVYTGLPCPGCGLTRSFLSLFHGHIGEAFFWHPLWWWVVLGPLLYWQLPRRTKTPEKTRTLIIWLTLAMLVLVYIIRMVYMFPHTPPMDFNGKALPVTLYNYIQGF